MLRLPPLGPINSRELLSAGRPQLIGYERLTTAEQPLQKVYDPVKRKLAPAHPYAQ